MSRANLVSGKEMSAILKHTHKHKHKHVHTHITDRYSRVEQFNLFIYLFSLKVEISLRAPDPFF